MTRKQWALLVMALLLGIFSLYLNRDWFAKDNIQIYHRSRPVRGGMFSRKRVQDSLVNPITFGFGRRVKLRSIKVIAVSDSETNKYPHAIWSMISDSNSPPVKDFSYGAPIPGMRPSVKGISPEALEPDVKYRLLVEGLDFKAEHDFVPVPRTP